MPPSKSRGRRKTSISAGSTTLFQKRQAKFLQGVAKLTSTAEARDGIRRLEHEFHDTADPSIRLFVARTASMAASRAKAMSQRADISVSKRLMFAEVGRMYRAAATSMFQKHKQSHSSVGKSGGAAVKKTAGQPAQTRRWTY